MSKQFCASPFCHETGERRCSRCLTSFYCSKECQKAHWKSHKESCLPMIQIVETHQEIAQGIVVTYTVSIDKFYSGAGIQPQIHTERMRKGTFSRDSEDNVTINIFAPKLVVAPVPTTITLPIDALLTNDALNVAWQNDIDTITGLMRCEELKVIVQRRSDIISNPPKTLTIMIIPKDQLPDWFKSEQRSKKEMKEDGEKTLNSLSPYLKDHGYATKIEDIEESDSEDDSNSEGSQEEENMVDTIGCKKAVSDLKNCKCQDSAVNALRKIVFLSKDNLNCETLVGVGLCSALKSIMSNYEYIAAVAALSAGIVTNVSLNSADRKIEMFKAGICERLVLSLQNFPQKSLFVMRKDWNLQTSGTNFQFSYSCDTVDDETDVQKWTCAAFFALSCDVYGAQTTPPRREMGKIPRVCETLVRAAKLHTSIKGSYVTYFASYAIAAMCSGGFTDEDEVNRQKMQKYGVCQVITDIVVINCDVPTLLAGALYAVKSLAMSASNRVVFSACGACALVCDSVRRSQESPPVCSWGARAINMLAMLCLPNQIQLMNSGAARLIVSLLKLHMENAEVSDACCRAIQNLSHVPEYVLVDFGEDVCEIVIKCVNTHNGNPVVLIQAINAMNNLTVADSGNIEKLCSLGAPTILESIAASRSYVSQVREVARQVLDKRLCI